MGKSGKKESKKSSKKKRSHHHVKEKDVLQYLLSKGLLEHPELNEELPTLVAAFDCGKEVLIPVNNEGPTQFLLTLFDALPLQRLQGNKWALKSGCKSIKKHIISRLLKCQAIIQPSELSSSQIISTKAMRILLSLLGHFPSLATEMCPLLENFIEGEGVDLGGIDNSTIKSGLVSFFIALGSESLSDDPLEFCDEFICPSSSSKRKHTVEAAQTVLDTLLASAVPATGGTDGSSDESVNEDAAGSS